MSNVPKFLSSLWIRDSQPKHTRTDRCNDAVFLRLAKHVVTKVADRLLPASVDDISRTVAVARSPLPAVFGPVRKFLCPFSVLDVPYARRRQLNEGSAVRRGFGAPQVWWGLYLCLHPMDVSLLYQGQGVYFRIRQRAEE